MRLVDFHIVVCQCKVEFDNQSNEIDLIPQYTGMMFVKKGTPENMNSFNKQLPSHIIYVYKAVYACDLHFQKKQVL